MTEVKRITFKKSFQRIAEMLDVRGNCISWLLPIVEFVEFDYDSGFIIYFYLFFTVTVILNKA